MKSYTSEGVWIVEHEDRVPGDRDERHCETAIRAEVSEIPGVTGIDVSAETGRLAVTAEQSVDDAAVIAAVDEAGYAAVRS